MKSPLTEYESLEALCEVADCAMIKPEGVEITDEVFQTIAGRHGVAEYRFKADGTQCILRFSKSGIETDISGIYVEDGTLLKDTSTETLCVIRNEYKVQRWVTADGQYVLEVFDNDTWSRTKFEEFIKPFMEI